MLYVLCILYIYFGYVTEILSYSMTQKWVGFWNYFFSNSYAKILKYDNHGILPNHLTG